MFSRRSFGKLIGSALAFIGFGRTKKVEAKSVFQSNGGPYLDNYYKFVNTSYNERMDFSDNRWGVSEDAPKLIKRFDYINRQVLEFREQEPIKLTGKPLKPMRDCWREAVEEVNAKCVAKEQ